MPSFLKKFKVLENQFHDLIPSDTVIGQFEDFLEDKYGYVKSFNEAQFMDYIINVNSGRAYDDLVE